ncbi:hypothetical protein [Curtobacterium sp. MCBA15_001]|uniref:hypothetical protein n=1 Tax=Curtobacterium sp. MCBA15_001 TaxID=1898731 RepID=UPI0008DDF09E|nr:hypothetical protein [Curtobacterium sp. MCBA15_001]OIH93532.1 hypothetical protein BIU90_07585 [Curtobacterium sp. MCBA15_001]
MGTASGGVATAAGLRFQYLAALDAVLDALDTTTDFLFDSESEADDVVDFAIRDPDGNHLLVVQAKAAVDGADGATVGVAELLEIAARLVAIDSERYRVVTNRRLGPSCGPLVALFDGSREPMSAVDLVGKLPHGSAASVVRILRGLGPDARARLRRVEVVEHIGPDALGEPVIARRVAAMRRNNASAVGVQASTVLTKYLVTEMLRLSARREDRSMSRDQVTRLVMLEDTVLASVLGRHERGKPIGSPPPVPTITRTALQQAVEAHLTWPPVERATRRLVITGLSGIGKSALARAYEAANAGRYDVRLWIDATSPATIEADVRGFLGDALGDRDPAAAFRSVVEQSTASWLVVFDGATGREALAQWVPDSALMDAIATSVDSTRWSRWHPVGATEMDDDEATDLLLDRLAMRDLDERSKESAERLVRHLGRWPLAIELGAAHLARSGHGLDGSVGYLDRLRERIIDDRALVPPDYASHPSLLAAVRIALEELERSQDANLPLTGRALLEAATFFPESVSMRLVATTAATSRASLTVPETPDPIDVDDACVPLHATALARRSTSSGALADRLHTNEVVLYLVRMQLDQRSFERLAVAAQIVVDDFVRSHSEREQYAAVRAALPAVMVAIDRCSEAALLIDRGLLTIGNIAEFFSVAGEFRAAGAYFAMELATLDRNAIDAPSLRAKIQVKRCVVLLHLGVDTDDQIAVVDDAVEQVERARSLLEGAELQQLTFQLRQVIDAISMSSSSPTAATVGRWRAALVRWSGTATPDHHGQAEIEGHLRRGDGSAALTIIEERLRSAPPAYIAVQLRAGRGEALALLGRWIEARDAIVGAIVSAVESGLGAGTLVSTGITILQLATTATLTGGEPEARAAAQSLAREIDGVGVELPQDAARLVLYRTALAADRGAVGRVSAALEAVDRSALVPTGLVRDVRFDHWTIATVGRLIDARSACGGAPAFLVDAVRGVHDHELWIGARGTTADEVGRATELTKASASWRVGADGVDIVLDDGLRRALLRLPLASAGWFSGPDLPVVESVAQLGSFLTERPTTCTVLVFSDLDRGTVMRMPLAAGHTAAQPL